MTTILKGIAVKTGNTVVHKLKDDGTATLGNSNTETSVYLKGNVIISDVDVKDAQGVQLPYGTTLATYLNTMAATTTTASSALASEVIRATTREDAIEAAYQAADASLTTSIQTLQSDVNTNESDFDTAAAALQSDVDGNESDFDTAIAAVQSDEDANEATAIADLASHASANSTARGVLQDDMNQNGEDFDADAAALQSDEDANEATAIADLASHASANSTARATMQSDMNTNKSDFNISLSALQADVNANEADFDSADATLQASIATATANRQSGDATLQTNIDALQADVNQNEADFDASMSSLTSDLSASGSARSSADTILQQNLAEQVIARQAHDTSMTGLIAVLESNTDPAAIDSLTEALGTIQNMSASQAQEIQDDLNDYLANISAHSASNVASFQALQADVDGNESDFEGYNATNAAAIASEEATMIAADAAKQALINSLQADVDANEAATDAADATLQSNIDTEEAARIAADATLTTNAAATQADEDDNEAAFFASSGSFVAALAASGTLRQQGDDSIQSSINTTDADRNKNANDFEASRQHRAQELATATTLRLDGDNALQININTLQSDVDANESDFDTALAAVQADEDANEAAFDAALAVVQADEDANEASFDADLASAASTNATARAAIQADVDANEAATDTAVAALQADVDGNESDFDTSDATLQANIATATANRIADDATLQTNIDALQTDVDTNEATNATERAALETKLSTDLAAEATARTTELSGAVLAVRDGTDPLVSDAGYPVLETLGELATALGDDANFAGTVTSGFAAAATHRAELAASASAADAAIQTLIDDEFANRDNDLFYAQDAFVEHMKARGAAEDALTDKLSLFNVDGTVHNSPVGLVSGSSSVVVTSGSTQLMGIHDHSMAFTADGTYTYNYDLMPDGTALFVSEPTAKFAVAPKFYFKEDGEWHGMPFSRTLDPTGDQDMDGVLNADDLDPYIASSFDGMIGDPYLPFYNGGAPYNENVIWKTEVDGMTASELAAFDKSSILPGVGSSADFTANGYGEYIGSEYVYNRVYLPIVADGSTVTTLTVYDAAGTGIYVGTGFKFTNYETYKSIPVAATFFNGAFSEMVEHHWQFKRDPDGRMYLRQGGSLRDGNGDVILDGDGYPQSDGGWTGWFEVDADDDGLTGVAETEPMHAMMKISEDAAQSFNTTGFNIASPAVTVTPAYDLVQNAGAAAYDGDWAGQETYEIVGGAQAASFSISRLTDGNQGIAALYSSPLDPSGALYWTSQPADGTYEVQVKVTVPKRSVNQQSDETEIYKTFVFTVASTVQYMVPYTVTSTNYGNEFAMFVDGATEVDFGGIASFSTLNGSFNMPADSTPVVVAITDSYGDGGPALSIDGTTWSESTPPGIQHPTNVSFSFVFDGTTLTIDGVAYLTWDSNTSSWS
jgi:hypothetical protein